MLHGEPGSGKTSIATWLATSDLARELFPDGVLASECGREPNMRGILASWHRTLRDWNVPAIDYEDEEEGTVALRAVLHHRACLLIVDDAWSAELVRTRFQVGGPRCALVVTTRVRDIATAIGADVVEVDGMEVTEAFQLLERWCGAIPAVDASSAKAIVDDVGALPLALELVGAQVERLESWTEFSKRWERHTERKLSLLEREPGASGRRDSVRDSLELSIAALDEETAQRFIALAVFPEKADISPCRSA